MQFTKPSEALRYGATLADQAFGMTLRRNGPNQIATCALAAIAHAVTGTPPRYYDDAIREFDRAFPQFSKAITPLIPSEHTDDIDDRPALLPQAIVLLNDDLKLPREEIADRIKAWGY